MSDHAKRSPSAASRWMGCPGSVAFIGDARSSDTLYSLEGTFAHDLFAQALLLDTDADSFVGRTKVVKLNGEDVTLTFKQEDVAPLQAAINYVRILVMNLDAEMHVEVKVKHHAAALEESNGTADVVLVSPGRLDVIDLKWGKGVAVAVEGNPQLMLYGGGAVDTIWRRDRPDEVLHTVGLHILQPRLNSMDSHEITRQELHDFIGDACKAAIATEMLDAPLIAGKHCKFCPKAQGCPAIYEQALAAAKDFFPTGDVAVTTDPPAPVEMSNEHLQRVLKLAPVIETWLSQVAAEALTRATRGERFDGYKLVERLSNRKWAKTEQEVAEALRLFGADPYVRELVSPAEAERRIGGPKKQQKALVDPLTTRTVNGYTLAPESDNRPAVQAANLQVTFDSLDEIE